MAHGRKVGGRGEWRRGRIYMDKDGGDRTRDKINKYKDKDRDRDKYKDEDNDRLRQQ